MSPDRAPLLSVQHLSVEYRTPRLLRRAERLRAVDDVTFAIAPGETVALVGESGCGKSTLARAIVQLIRPTAGEIYLDDGRGIIACCALRGERLRQMRRQIQMVFQDGYSSLDPRLTAAAIVAEPLRNFGIARGRAARDRAAELLDLVGLGTDALDRYPHEFSGGQRQRIGLARALAPQPRLLLCDEPVSALDVSVQAQIINLLKDLQKRLGLTMLFISHDLAVVRHLAHRVAVMRAGRIVELATADDLYRTPQHAYTRELLAAVPEVPRR